MSAFFRMLQKNEIECTVRAGLRADSLRSRIRSLRESGSGRAAALANSPLCDSWALPYVEGAPRLMVSDLNGWLTVALDAEHTAHRLGGYRALC